MRRAEEGLLMLTCALGQAVQPLTPAEYRYLSERVHRFLKIDPEQELTTEHLLSIGYRMGEAERIVALLDREDALHRYLESEDVGIMTRLDPKYPQGLRKLNHAPLVLFYKGERALFDSNCVALVGARKASEASIRFAAHIGELAAKEGFTLVSGGAVGADQAAQRACLEAGGRVICFVPDALKRYQTMPNVLFCSDEGFDCEFSASRALRRNHFIHAMGEKVFVAACLKPSGGTWSGTSYNLNHNLCEVYVFDDGMAGTAALLRRNCTAVDESLHSIADLMPEQLSIFD